MFDVIEQARMMLGIKAIATLSTGYLNQPVQDRAWLSAVPDELRRPGHRLAPAVAAAIAVAALDSGTRGAPKAGDRAFYEGKIATASLSTKNFLPLLTRIRDVVETLDNEVMEPDGSAF